jgi:hypothetical protein
MELSANMSPQTADNKFHLLHAILLIMLGIMTACGVTPTSEPTSTSTGSLTPTLIPSPTPTSGPGEVLLYIPETLDSIGSKAIEDSINTLADANGLVVRLVESDLVGMISSETRVVVSMESIDGIEQVASDNPQIGLITVGVVTEGPTNLYSIRQPSESYDKSGFLAGYIAALVTADYRAGAIALSGDGKENAALQGFLNGVTFYCGLCRAAYPPFNSYPQSQLISSAEPGPLLDAVQAMRDLGVTTIYLSPGLNKPELFDALRGTDDIQFIGSGVPVDTEGYTWIVTVTTDIATGIQQAWEAWLAGESITVIDPPLAVFHPDESLLSPGKLEHIESIIQDLESGRIDPGVDPLTGEER